MIEESRSHVIKKGVRVSGMFGSIFDAKMSTVSDNSADLVIEMSGNQFDCLKLEDTDRGKRLTIYGNMEHREFLSAMAAVHRELFGAYEE